MPAEYTKPSNDLVGDREVIIEAAAAYDRARRERDELKHRLDQAMLGLEAKNSQIMQLEAALAEERNRVQSYQAERDEAVDGRINAEARLADIKAIIERAELPPPKQRRRGRAVGDLGRPIVEPPANGDTVPEQAGSQAQVAEPTHNVEPAS